MPITHPDALALLETRRTIAYQEFAEPGPSEDELRRLIAAAVRVPDHGKLTPWRFVVVRGPARATLEERLFALWQTRFPDAPEGKRLQENMSVVPKAEQTDPLVQYTLHTDHWCVFGFGASWQ